MKTRKLLPIAALALLSVAGSAHAANLIVDGDFVNAPSPPPSPGFTTYNSGSSFGGLGGDAWSVTGGSVDLINTYWQSPSSVLNGGSVDMDGNTPGTITQSFTAPAGSYVLTFSLSGNPDGLPSTKSLQVSVGGTTEVVTYTIGANNYANMMYTPESLAFTTAGGSVNLTFTSLDTLPGTFGAVVGKVAVNAVPLPPSLWLFGSALMSLVAFAWMKSRRRAII